MDPVLLNVVSLKAASQRGEVLVRYTTSQWVNGALICPYEFTNEEWCQVGVFTNRSAVVVRHRRRVCGSEKVPDKG